MIRFTVVWEDDTEDQLAEYWNDSQRRQSITDAADNIDRELAIDANLKGTDLAEGLRASSVHR